jgi:hypothetical protein
MVICDNWKMVEKWNYNQGIQPAQDKFGNGIDQYAGDIRRANRFYKNLASKNYITFLLNKTIDECSMTTIIISLTECLNPMRPTLV